MERAGSLPARDHLVLRGAIVMTMDPALGTLDPGDVELANGVIAAVARDIPAPGARSIDARHLVVLPGFVDTHWHLWGSMLRGIVGDGPETGWFARKAQLGPHFLPADTAASVALGVAEGIRAGVTTVHDWAHNVLSGQDADANVQALVESGVRAHWSYGTPSTTPGLSLAEMASVMARVGRNVGEPMPFDVVEGVRDAWVPRGDGRLTVGVNVRGPARSTPDVYRWEFAAARERDLPIAMHCAGTAAEVRQVPQAARLADEGLLGPDLLFAHGNHLSPDEMAALAAHGVGVSVSPASELRLAMGLPRVRELLDAGVRVSLSVDTTAITGRVDPFAQLRLLVGVERARAETVDALAPGRALELATIEGARSLGLGETTGSLTPGKRADVIGVRRAGLGPEPLLDPASAVVHGASADDVELVAVDGRVLVADGRLAHLDLDDLREAATGALAALRRRAAAGEVTAVRQA